ncbi:hypothetical protein FOA52_002253 [Chlamydomonas sp. UWO 241]|nr:hypothetical protein FOA52_002253 [Chlamydomonas sp. UWO 241]
MRRRSFVLSIPVARGANWFLAGGGRRMDEEEATAAAAERIAAAAEDGTSLPVRLATDVVRFLYGGTGRREPADGGVVSASLLNAKPAVGGIGVEPRGGGVLRVLFTVASDALADTVVRWRHELRRCVDSTAVFDVLSDREEAQHQALWPAFLAAKVAGKRAQFHRARLVVDGERARATVSVLREIKLLKQLKGHAYIEQLERVHTSPCGGRIYLIMEHLPTTLAMLLQDPGPGLPLEQARGICRQVLIALRYLHAREIGHHGLSPSNILLTPGNGSAKLSDFSLAGLPGDLAAGNARWYRAPEQLVGASVGCEADVWALGCILFEMVAGEPLLPGNFDDEQLTLVERVVGALPARFQLGRSAAAAGASAGSSSVAASMHERSGCIADMLCARGVHPDLVDVVAACLEGDPLNRASARDLLLMPLFQVGCKTGRSFSCRGAWAGIMGRIAWAGEHGQKNMGRGAWAE